MNIDENIVEMDYCPIIYKGGFETVSNIKAAHQDRVFRVLNNEPMGMVWEVDSYVFSKLKSSSWGDGVVHVLVEYKHT